MGGPSQQKTHGMAIASLVLGCFFLIPILGILTSLLAIIFGAVALATISNKKEIYKGNGLAIGGIVLGVIGIIIIPIIALLAAIAIPNFMRAKMMAQESSAAASMRMIAVAELQYRDANSSYATLSTLASETPPYIDSELASGTKQGYNFVMSGAGESGFYVVASPQAGYGHTFYIDEDGTLCRSNTNSNVNVSGHQSDGCPADFSEPR